MVKAWGVSGGGVVEQWGAVEVRWLTAVAEVDQWWSCSGLVVILVSSPEFGFGSLQARRGRRQLRLGSDLG
jgi:hypothetical protein